MAPLHTGSVHCKDCSSKCEWVSHSGIFHYKRSSPGWSVVTIFICVTSSAVDLYDGEPPRYTWYFSVDRNVCTTATFYAEDTTIMERSPADATSLYNTTEKFCKGTKDKLHAEKCAAIAAWQMSQSLPNGIPVLLPHQLTTVLGLSVGDIKLAKNN